MSTRKCWRARIAGHVPNPRSKASVCVVRSAKAACCRALSCSAGNAAATSSSSDHKIGVLGRELFRIRRRLVPERLVGGEDEIAVNHSDGVVIERDSIEPGHPIRRPQQTFERCIGALPIEIAFTPSSFTHRVLLHSRSSNLGALAFVKFRDHLANRVDQERQQFGLDLDESLLVEILNDEAGVSMVQPESLSVSARSPAQAALGSETRSASERIFSAVSLSICRGCFPL